MKLLTRVLCMLPPALVAVAAPPNLWVVGSLVRLGPTAAPGGQTQITLYAARGEYESFQVGIQAPAGGLTNVNVSVSALTGPAGQVIPASNLSLFRENYVTIPSGQTTPTSSSCTECSLGPGTYPDGLIPFVDPDTGSPLSGALQAVPFSLPAGQTQPIWVDVLVPRTATSGQYAGSVTITSDQGQAEASLVLNVWNFTLPLAPSLKSSIGVYHPGTDAELGRNRLMTDTTVSATEATSLQTNWGFSAVDTGFFSGAVYGNCNATPPPSVMQVQAVADPYRQLGLFVYDYSFDEIDKCTNLFPLVIQWARQLHQAGVPQLITMEPVPSLYDDGQGTGRSAVDIWVVLPAEYNDAQSFNPPRVTTVLAHGDQVWSYQALAQDDYSPKWQVDFPPIGLRLQPGFISQSLGLTGLLYSLADGWLSGTGPASWNNVNYQQGGSSFPGEGILVYPGEAVGMNGKVAPSMRLKWLRDGVEDYEYVQILKGLGQGDWALQTIASVGADWSNWTRNPTALEAARISLGQRIQSLAGVPSSSLLPPTALKASSL
jgi:hypothetical protein